MVKVIHLYWEIPPKIAHFRFLLFIGGLFVGPLYFQNFRLKFYKILHPVKDSNYDPETQEVIHYGISNISKTNVEIAENAETSGNSEKFTFDTWCEYLPPIPAKGSGYHRFVANLYHQTERLDVGENLIKFDNLIGRSFSSADYLRKNEDNLTPTSFTFSQGTSILEWRFLPNFGFI